MIKTFSTDNPIWIFEHAFELQDNRKYLFKWRAEVQSYNVCGHSPEIRIEVYKTIRNSIRVAELNEYGLPKRDLNIDRINLIERINLKTNCHGFTFTNGHYWLDSSFVDIILTEEFHEVNDVQKINNLQYDIVCFKKDDEWIHSVKHLYGLYLHKEGIRGFSVHESLDEIVSIPEYKGTEKVYFKRNQELCSGICTKEII